MEESVSERSLRVFEIARISSGQDLGSLVVDLPVALANRRPSVRIVFLDGGSDLGWHAHVTDVDGYVLLSFPWTDHVDRILINDDPGQLPVTVPQEGWDDLDQGWWGRVMPDGSDVYVAETDFDAITEVTDQSRIENPVPGLVLVDDVEVRWHVVSRGSWDKAWTQAVEACRRGHPAPVGEWDDDSNGRLVIHESS